MRPAFAVAEHMVVRASEELRRDDEVQVSGKLYRAAEECIRALTCIRGHRGVQED